MNRSYVLPFSVLSLMLAACGIENSLVGGECNSGYTAEHGLCVSNAKSDASAPTTLPTTSPTTSPVSTVQPTQPVPGSDAGDAGDTGAPDASVPDTSIPVVDPPGPVVDPPGPVVDPPVDPPVNPPADAGADADPPIVIVTPPEPPPPVTCASDEAACNDVCTPVKTDGQNCGACGRVCPSNICVDGECKGATPGDIVVIGHDMTKADTFTTHAKVFKNAVHLPTTDPLRVLAFEQDASGELVTKTRALTGASLGSRSLKFGQAAPEALESGSLYADWDVVLIDAVSAANASAYGTRWAAALDTFTKKGGVLVALDNGEGDIPGFFTATSLLNLGTHQSLPSGTAFVVSAPGDTVGAQLLSPYAAFGPSVAFVGAPVSTADFTWVVKTADPSIDAPTVIHKIAR